MSPSKAALRYATISLVALALVACGSGQGIEGRTKERTNSVSGPLGERPQALVDLHLRFQEGAQHRIRMQMQQNIVQVIGDQTIETPQGMEFGYALSVREVMADGSARVALRYESVRFLQQTPVGSVEYDSAKASQDSPFAASFGALAGKEFSLIISPKGEITHVSGLDEIAETMVDKLDLPPGILHDSVRDQLRTQFGEESLQGSLQQMIGFYPDHPVRIGESWSKETFIPGAFPQTLENTWTLQNIDGGFAMIEGSSSIVEAAEAQPLTIGPATLRFNMSGMQQSTFTVDMRTGWLAQGKIMQETQGSMMITNELTGQEGTWPTSAVSTITFETY